MQNALQAEERRKKEKTEKLKAKKMAEVLAVTRGDDGESDVEILDDTALYEPVKTETLQEVCKLVGAFADCVISDLPCKGM